MKPEDLLNASAQLQGRVKAGVDCDEMDCMKTASGYCITCNQVLCEDHDMAHLMADDMGPDDCRVKKKIRMIQAHIENDRLNSPDGMTSWDRVEKHRIEKGHLPEGNAYCVKCYPDGPPQPAGKCGECRGNKYVDYGRNPAAEGFSDPSKKYGIHLCPTCGGTGERT